MSNELLSEFLNKLEEKFNAEKIVFDFFKTEKGITFQENITDLLRFSYFGILTLEILPYGLKLIDLFDPKLILQKVDEQTIKKLVNEEEISEERIQEIERDIQKELQNIDIREAMDEHMEQNPLYNPKFKSKERLYSNYFISLFAYIDFYTTTISKDIISKISDNEYYDFADKLKLKDSPNDKLNLIKKRLNLISDNDLDDLLEEKSWRTTFCDLKGIRDKLAHRNPLANIDTIRNKFPEPFRKAKKKTQDYSKALDKFGSNFVKDILKDFIILLQDLALLLEIGMECAGYLAIFDYLIHNYFINNND